MKRWWLLAAFLAVAVPMAATAQTAVGLRAGSRWSQLDTSQESGSLNSLVFGGYFGAGLSNRIALQIEVIYGTRGADALRVGDGVLADTATPARVETSYLEIPILLRTGFPMERLLPSFFVGPYVGILLNCDLDPDGDAPEQSCDEEGADQRFSPRGNDFGLTMGGALDLILGESTAFIDARYSIGLLSLESGDDAFDARHSGFSVSAGFAFPLGQ
jgi:hypothetical protein